MGRLCLQLLCGAWLLAGCTAGHQFYAGPERPRGELARIECFRYGEELALLAVDGRETPHSYILVMPGLHHLTLRGPKNITAERNPELLQDGHVSRPVVEVDLEVAAGRWYFLGVTFKNQVGTRARYDGGHYYEEGSYGAWSLDVYERAATSSKMPDLIRSFEFKAE